MLDQLDREKELHETLTETTRDRLEQMKIVLEDRKSEVHTLKKKVETSDKEAYDAKCKVDELEKRIESMKEIHQQELNKFKDTFEKFEVEKNELETRLRSAAEIKDDVIDEQKLKMKEAATKEVSLLREISILKEDMARSNEDHLTSMEKLGNKLLKERESLKQELIEKVHILEEKLNKALAERGRFEEEVTRLKSSAISDKLRAEEDMLSMHSKWKQDEHLKNKQYDERINMMQSMKDELNQKCSKLNMQLSESQTQLCSCQKELENASRQVEQQKLLLEQKETEMRNEINRARIEFDNERRSHAESKDKVSVLERNIQDLNMRSKETVTAKDTEIASLKGQLQSRESEIDRIRDDELRRASILENALQTYIMGVRSPRK